MTVPELPPDWYHARFQAVSRAQARYLLLLLIIAAYTFSLDFTSVETVSVTAIGLPEIPKAIVRVAATPVLTVLLLALFGTLRSAGVAFAEMLARLGRQGVGTKMYQVDLHPNVADFVGYATWSGEKPGGLTRTAALVLYPLPVLACMAWTVVLWWRGITGACGWLVWVYRANSLLVLFVAWATALFMRRRWQLFRQGRFV